ncbi:hypothetical protein [Caldithrix abyssi]|uniref:Mobile element protein n=1 Tax=Caldithrix abyssi DSM 13497 TaxID=880073 RepID=A0A1J1CBP5_CALAY|nr:hypothetical protein [Caldithrix abyssi]APF20131.1 Mobile element protein [Caldithrix abyssi DSM 13497]
MQIYGKIFSEPILKRINAIIARQPQISRRKLSREVCELMDWKSPNGKFQEMSCRKALLELDRRGLIPSLTVNAKFFKAKSKKTYN